MQSVVAAEKPSPKQISRLFNFEAEYSKSFAEHTVVPPAIAENPVDFSSQLTDDLWLIINGEKGSGKTSYLYHIRHELMSRKSADLPGLSKEIPLYIAFDSDDVKREVATQEEKTHFLVNYFYRPLLRELSSYLNDMLQRPPQVEGIVAEMIGSLCVQPSEFLPLRQPRVQKKKSGGFSNRFRRLFFGENATEDESETRDRLETVAETRSEVGTNGTLQQTGQSVDYSKFRNGLIRLINALEADHVYFLLDEVNEQRLSVSQQQALFDHLYNTYRSTKENIVVKIATTSSVIIPDFIFHGHYFMAMELSSMLVHPFEYEDMLRAIFELRLENICSNNTGDEARALSQPGSSVKFSDFFTENSFRELAQASMGNVREFFYLSKMAYNQSLPAGKIEHVHAQRVIRSRAIELEQRIMEKGGEELNELYLHLVSLLKERSDKQSAKHSKESVDSFEANNLHEVPNREQERIADRDSKGISYFVISNYDTLSIRNRELIDKLEDEKIIFGTGEWKSLRRKGEKQQMYAISYPICSLRGINWQDVSGLVKLGLGTERELIDQHRCQITV